MCVTTGICGGMVGLLGMLIAIVLGGATTVVSGIGLGLTCCIGTCGVISSVLAGACALGIVGILGIFGVCTFGIMADLIAGSTIGGYLKYLSTLFDEGGGLADAFRICIVGK